MNRILEGDYQWLDINSSEVMQRPPLPRLDPHGDVIREARMERDGLAVALSTQASGREIATAMVTLQAHYWRPNMPEAVMRAVADDFARFLAEFPIVVIAEARDRLLLDPERKHAPRIGEIVEACKVVQGAMKWRLRRLEKLIAVAEA